MRKQKIRPLVLASKIDKKKIMFVQNLFLDLLFLIFSIFVQKWSILQPASKSDGRQNAPKSTKWRQNAKKALWLMLIFGVFFQTLFSRKHSSPCAVGTSWLLKGHFFHGDCLTFCFVAFLCASFYITF